MTDSEAVGRTRREELVQRIELMEAMIGEGRRATARFGWAFLLWGVMDGAVMLWQRLMPHSNWVGKWGWPLGLITAAVLTLVGLAMRCQEGGRARMNFQLRTIGAVWAVMGMALTIYIGGAMTSGFTWQVSYMAGVLLMVGMAHAISALVLRWWGQAVFAMAWGIGGGLMFTDPTRTELQLIMLVEMCVGMIVFGIYTMVLERRYRG